MSLADTLAHIKETFGNSILDVTEFSGDKILHIKCEAVSDILSCFKEMGFNFLFELTAVDNLTLGGFERFAVVYHLLSHKTIDRITVKAYVPEDNPVISSVESLWKTADWQEREVFDLFGITFEGHPNLIRILNPEEYKGYPLRKDYPREGRGERKNFPIVERRIGNKGRTRMTG